MPSRNATGKSRGARAVFVIGPSCIGKSSLLARLHAAEDNYNVLSLDAVAAAEGMNRGFIDRKKAVDLLTAVGDEKFFMAGMIGLFNALACAGMSKITVVDVGAAFQNVALLANMSFFYPVICIAADERAAYERFCRFRSTERPFERYRSIEFSEVRKKVYASATNRIDTTNMSLDVAYERLLELLNDVSARWWTD